ncbi:hypothetical protein [Veillonella seminalis]|jgi:hypothetical protein|uniref:hypothetical protein n=1 Tax=Veillonella seminalis TaxID=1502943 RepID=UPI002048CEDE|nr:MAG TPA: hypothetical protein [Caudoviricetes sp.]
MLVETNDWAVSRNGENFYRCDSSSREGAIEEVDKGRIFDQEDLMTDWGVRSFYIGKVYEFEPVIDVDSIIERLQYECEDQVGENADGYLSDASIEELEDLEQRLTKTFKEWVDESGLNTSAFAVLDYDLITLEPVEVEE